MKIGGINSTHFMLQSTFQNCPVAAEGSWKVILTRVVWLEATRRGVTEEGKPRSQMSYENEMISQRVSPLNCAGACGGI
jgi:hypothetical protein